jgi:hypothetical protein
MQKLQLYIGGERIDLFKDEQVSFNQSIQNIKDPAKIFTEFTQTFTVPASKVNNQVFEHYYNFNIVGGFDARNKVDANIELNNVAFKQGYIRLEGVDMKLNKVYAYRITFFGETVNIKDILREDKLGNLSDLNQYNLNYDAATVKARLQSASGAILCPLITSGASGEESRLFYNSNNSAHTDNTGNLYYHTGSSNDHGVLYSDLKYAIRLYEIVEAIKVTYPSLVFTDDFFSTSNAEFYNLHMWLHRKKGSVAPAEQIAAFPTLVTGFGLPQTYTNMIDSSGLQIDANYLPTITQRLTINTSSTDSYDVIINRGTTVWFTASNLTGNSLFDQGDMGFMDAATYTVIIRTTTNITFSLIEWDLSGYQPTSPPVGWAETYDITNFSATATFQFVITEQIPDMKIIDFLTGIFRMFNLTAYYVSNRQDADYGKIKVQKLDDFYIAGTSYDISEYVDTNTSQVNVALPYKEIEFGYEGTGTLLALQYEQLQGKSWGAEKFTGNATVGNNFDAPNPTYKVTLPFEHIQMERLVNVNPDLASPQTTIQYGYFVDDNLEAYFGKPLIFYPILQTSGTEISFRDSATTHSPLTTYFIPSNSLSLSSATSTKNINFYLEVNEYSLDTNFTGTLFEENYLEYIQDIFNSKRRLTKLKAYLPLKIIYNLNMNDRVVINNQSYNINNLTSNLITGESSMELLNNNYIGNVSGNFRVLTDVYQTYPNYSNYYYESQIGAAQNLSNGDVIYTDTALTTTLVAGTYYQVGSSETTTRCINSSYQMSMTVNSSGVITNILCDQP